MPSILLWVLAYSVHKRLRPYPTGQELQNYHSQLEKADHLGNQFSQRVFSSSVLDVREGWRLLRLTNKTINIQFRSKKAKSPKDQRASGSKHQEEEGTADAEDLPDSESAGPPEELDEYDAELGDFKRVALYYLTCLADFHERFQKSVNFVYLHKRFADTCIPQYILMAQPGSVETIHYGIIPSLRVHLLALTCYRG